MTHALGSGKSGLWLASAAGALAMGLVSAASAQEVQAAAADEAVEGGIGEIVVTAQKRDQSVQDVGITMSVLSSEALANGGVTSVTDITGMVPNVQANYGAGQVAFNVRGIGTNEFSANLDSPIAVNLDEVYLSKTFMTGLLLFDVDRVEVLKGPQGTLFGRNATGGTVNFFSRRPQTEFGAGANVSYDNYRTVRSEAYVTGPLGGDFSARLSGLYVNQDKGYYRNLTLDRREGEEKKWALRGQVAWDNGVTNALLTVNAGRQWGTLQPYEGVGIFTPESLADGAPVLCAPYAAGAATGADAGCVRGTDGLYPGDDDPHTSNNNRLHTVKNKSLGTTLRIEHDLGESTLTSLTSYQHFRRMQHEDSDGTPVDTLDVDYYNRINQFTQEVRLTSSGERTWNYVVGAYYEHDDYKNGDYLTVGYGAAPGYYSPFTQKVDALALFFHNDVALTDTLGLTAGVRYSREKVSFDGGTYAGTGRAGSPIRPSTIVATLAEADESRTDDAATFKVGIEWKPVINSASVDKLMLFANASTGFRSGSYNGEFVGSPEALTSLAPEKITAYEAGWKSILFGRSLLFNASAYHYKFTDGFINVDSTTSPIPITINAANISTYGVEFDLQWQPVEQLSFGMGGGWLQSKIDSDISTGGTSLKGNRTVQSPRWTYNAQATFTQPLGNDLELALTGDANYRSAQYFETTNSPNSLEPGYWLVNARLALKGPDDRWSVGFFAKNLTKTTYRTYVNDLAAFGFLLNIHGAPRTYGVSASFKL